METITAEDSDERVKFVLANGNAIVCHLSQDRDEVVCIALMAGRGSPRLWARGRADNVMVLALTTDKDK